MKFSLQDTKNQGLIQIKRVPNHSKSVDYWFLSCTKSRRFNRINSAMLKKIGVVMKKAQYFITCNELAVHTINELKPEYIRKILVQKKVTKNDNTVQLTLFT